MIKTPEKNQPSGCDLAAKPAVNLLRLPAKPVVVNDHDRRAEFRDVARHLRRPLLFKTQLAKMPVRGRLESRRAVESEAMMKRVTEQIQRLRISFFDGQLDVSAAILRIPEPAVDGIDLDDCVFPPDSGSHVENRNREQDEKRDRALPAHQSGGAESRRKGKADVRDDRPSRWNSDALERLDAVIEHRMKERVHAERSEQTDRDPEHTDPKRARQSHNRSLDQQSNENE